MSDVLLALIIGCFVGSALATAIIIAAEVYYHE